MCLISSTAIFVFDQPLPLVANFSFHQIDLSAMLQGRLPLSLFISLGIILCVSGTPAPPPMQHTSLYTDNGHRHSWHAWEPDANFQESSLRAYAKAAHDEVHQQATLYYPRVWKKDRPCTVASLWVKDKGIYSASDLGRDANYMKAPLHPKTQALFEKCSQRRNRAGGYCSCIQAIDGFHTRFPNDDIPEGSLLAVYGRRDRHTSTPKKIMRPCRADHVGPGCKAVISAAGVECDYDPPARGRSSRPTFVPDPNFPTGAYVTSDESLSATST